MIKESDIIAQLDGKFFRMTHNGVRSIVVEMNGENTPVEDVLLKKALVPYQRPWTDEENVTLIDLRGQGVGWKTIARYMRRSIRIIRLRYSEVCLERGITPFPKRGRK